MLNRIVIVGRTTREPELRYTQSGTAVVNFTVACDRTFSNQNGEKETDFIDCVAWRQQAENIAKYVGKGEMIGVDGRLQISSYQDNNGNNRRKAEVVADNVRFLEPKKRDNEQGKAASQGAPQQGAYPQAQQQQATQGGYPQQPTQQVPQGNGFVPQQPVQQGYPQQQMAQQPGTNPNPQGYPQTQQQYNNIPW